MAVQTVMTLREPADVGAGDATPEAAPANWRALLVLPVRPLRVIPVVPSAAPSVTAPVLAAGVGATVAPGLAAGQVCLGFSVWNEGPGSCYLKKGDNATAADYSVVLAAGAYYELPSLDGYSEKWTGFSVIGCTLHITRTYYVVP